MVEQCGRQTQAGEWTREGREGNVQEDIEAFGRGEEYPDYIRAVAARAIGAGNDVTMSAVSRAHWRPTTQRGTTEGGGEQCGICREADEGGGRMTRWPG